MSKGWMVQIVSPISPYNRENTGNKLKILWNKGGVRT